MWQLWRLVGNGKYWAKGHAVVQENRKGLNEGTQTVLINRATERQSGSRSQIENMPARGPCSAPPKPSQESPGERAIEEPAGG